MKTIDRDAVLQLLNEKTPTIESEESLHFFGGFCRAGSYVENFPTEDRYTIPEAVNFLADQLSQGRMFCTSCRKMKEIQVKKDNFQLQGIALEKLKAVLEEAEWEAVMEEARRVGLTKEDLF